MATIRIGAYGWIHEIAVTHEAGGAPYDMSASDLTNAILLVPSRGATKTVTPTFTNTGADGLVRYTVAAGLFDKVGRWRVLVNVAKAGGLNGATSAAVVDVQRITPEDS